MAKTFSFEEALRPETFSFEEAVGTPVVDRGPVPEGDPLTRVTPSSPSTTNATASVTATDGQFQRPGFAEGFNKGLMDSKRPLTPGGMLLRAADAFTGGAGQERYNVKNRSVLDDKTDPALADDFAKPVETPKRPSVMEPRTPSIYPTGGAMDALADVPMNTLRSAGSSVMNFGALAAEFGLTIQSAEEFRKMADQLDSAKARTGLGVSDQPLAKTGTALDALIPSAKTLADYAPEGLKQLGMIAGMGPGAIVADAGTRGVSKARGEGLSLGTSLAYGAGQAATEGVPEMVSAKFAIASAKKIPLAAALRGDAKAVTTAFQQTAQSMGVELGSEEVSALGNWVVDRIAADPTATPDRLVADMQEAVKATLVQGPTMLAGAKAMQVAASALPKRLPPPGPSAEDIAKRKGFLIDQGNQRAAADIVAAPTVDDAIAAADQAVSQSVDLANTPLPTELPLQDAANDVAPANEAVDNIARLLGQEPANVSQPGEIRPLDSTSPGSGGVEPGVGLEAGVGTVDPAGPALDAGSSPNIPTGDAAPLGARQPAQLSTEPTSTWFGRRGDGYQTEADAAVALPTRQKTAPDLDWKIEQMPSGRYRLAGYAPTDAQYADDQQGNNPQSFSGTAGSSSPVWANGTTDAEGADGNGVLISPLEIRGGGRRTDEGIGPNLGDAGSLGRDDAPAPFLPAYRVTLNPTGTATVYGDPTAIKARLTQAGIDKMIVGSGKVTVAVPQAQAAVSAINAPLPPINTMHDATNTVAEQASNVQNTAQGTPGQAQAPQAEARAATGGDEAQAPAKPAAAGPAEVEAAGVEGAGVSKKDFKVGGRDPHDRTYERRSDGRLTRTITYPDGQTSTETLVTDKNGDEIWISNDRYEKGGFYPVQMSQEQAAAAIRDDMAGKKTAPTGAAGAPNPPAAQVEGGGVANPPTQAQAGTLAEGAGESRPEPVAATVKDSLTPDPRLIPVSQRNVPKNQANPNTSAEPAQKTPESEQVDAPVAPAKIGRDGIDLADGGKPFVTRNEAKRLQRQQPMMRVVKAPGGYILTEKTEAQIAAQEKAARRLSVANIGSPGVPIAAHEFIAGEGGMSKKEMSDMGIEGNKKIGNRWLFAGQGLGMTIERATEKLVEAGYLREGASHNDAYALIKRSMTHPQYTPEGTERMAEAEREARFEDYMAAQQEAATDEDPFGPAPAFTPAEVMVVPKSAREEYAALMEAAEAAGVDVDAILEEAARIPENQTQEQFNEYVRQALTDAIADSRRQADRRESAVQGREDAQRGGTEGSRQDAGRPGAQEEGLTDPKQLERDFRTYPERVLEAIIARGDGQSLYRAARVKSADAFSVLPMDDRAAAYVAYVQAGAKPVEGLPKDYNAWAAAQERDAENRRMQTERVITQANGRPFRTEQAARQAQERFDTQSTHKIAAVDGGFELRLLSPSAQAEARRIAAGQESYTEAQAAVLAEMGIGETADGEIDATDAQWEEIDRRVAARMRGEIGLTAPTPAQVLEQQRQREAEQQRKEQGGDKPLPAKQLTGDVPDMFDYQGGIFDQPAEPEPQQPASADNGLMFSRAQPFYSALSKSIEGMTPKALPGAIWKDGIKGLINKGAVKEDEVEWSGIREWLDLQIGKVSKEDVLAYLDANGVQVQEVVLGAKAKYAGYDSDIAKLRDAGFTVDRNPEDASVMAFMDENGELMDAVELESLVDNGEISQDVADAASRIENAEQGDVTGTKYSQYTLPGGERYREVLLTLPEKKNAPIGGGKSAATMLFERDMMEKYAGETFPSVYGKLNGNEIDKYEMLVREDRNSAKSESMAQDRRNNYKSSHWDQPNVLAHIRLNDRTDADGNRVLFVEEVQSDFGQDAKKQRDAINRAVDDDFTGIIERMKRAGVLEVSCD